jgi:hypothetical protein
MDSGALGQNRLGANNRFKVIAKIRVISRINLCIYR